MKLPPILRNLMALAALTLFAGCVQDPGPASAANVDADEDADLARQGGLVEGERFLPPTSGQDRVETLVEIPANASAMRITASLALGARYGSIDAPLPTADVLVEIRGPNGDVLAEAHLGSQETEAQLDAETVEDGAHTLAILSYGGSDGRENGDYVAYRIEARENSEEPRDA